MRVTLQIHHSVLLIIVLFISACVSVGFKPPVTEKSKTISYLEPDKIFAEASSKQLDRLWHNHSNGSTISFLSECNNSTDPTLENIFKGITSELDEVNTLELNRVSYNSRDALHAQVEGAVDGVLTRFELMIFKKNSCTYILTYASAAAVFGTGQREFHKFVKGFSVP